LIRQGFRETGKNRVVLFARMTHCILSNQDRTREAAMVERQASEKSIFLEALEIASPEERASYVEAACGGDQHLREEVEALLRAYDRPRRLLDSPGSLTPTVGHEPLTERVGSLVGAYKLMEQIGEGGMGVVYVAEQTQPVRRKVALKIVKPGMDTRQVVARFEAERQALAMMDHPNIAKVLDGGTTASGRPYFVMELVRGLPITEYCDAERLSIRQRLELFVLVCRAVQHAHQKGIIHRDLKPSNILVTLHDGVPVPEVIDFGVAKATGQVLTDKTVYTAFTQLIGTPLYMSPEQVELSGLDVDTRSDIYSLGVLLYELLTGTTPFDAETLKKAAFDEMRRIIREQEPPKPSTRLSTLGEALTTTSAKRSSDPRHLDRSVRGELDWIVMKALEKDRHRRYETANDFAAEVMRYLTDQPVEACPPSASYRLAKFARRNRAALMTTALLLAMLVLCTVVSTWQAIRARRAERDAVAAWAQESRQRRQVEQQRNRAVEAEKLARSNEQDAKRSQADTQAFSDFLVNDMLAVARPEGVQGGLGVGVTVAQALEAAEANLEKRFAGRPLAEATAHDAIGRTWRNLARYEQAERHLRRAVELREQHLGRDDSATLDSRNSLGVTLTQMGCPDEALPLHEETLEKRRAKLGPNHPETLNGMRNLAQAYRAAGKFDQALPLLEMTLEKMKAKLGPDHPDTLLSMHNLGSAYMAAGKFDQAMPLLEETVQMQKAKLGPDHPHTLISVHNLAIVYQLSNQSDRAVSLYEETVEKMRAKFGPDHPTTLQNVGNLASAYRDTGRPDKAEPLFLEVVSGLRLKLGLAHPTTQTYIRHLTVCYSKLRQPEKAEPLLRELTAFWKDKDGDDSPQHATHLIALGQNLLEQQRPADAEPLLRQGLLIREKSESDAWTTFNARSLLGGSLLGQKHYAEAEPLLLSGYEGLKQREETIPPQHKARPTEALERLVQLYDAWGRKDKADEWRRKLTDAESAKPAETRNDGSPRGL
jgi:serine/threonine protein kinase